MGVSEAHSAAFRIAKYFGFAALAYVAILGAYSLFMFGQTKSQLLTYGLSDSTATLFATGVMLLAIAFRARGLMTVSFVPLTMCLRVLRRLSRCDVLRLEAGTVARGRMQRRHRGCRLHLIVVLSAIAYTAESKEPSFAIGTGSENGFYFEFGQAVGMAFESSGLADFSIYAVSTNGSVDNLSKIQSGELDLAIVQNDIAYYVYEGIRGYEAFDDFSAGIPLFEEYIQVLVARDSEIHTLGELENKTISLGPDGSGSYHNAMDLLSEAGFNAGIDFQAAYLDISESLPRLLSGEIDAIVHTGSAVPNNGTNDANGIRMLPLSREIVRSLALRSPYYTAANPKIQIGQHSHRVSTVSLTAFLIFSDRVSNAQARKVVALIDQIGPHVHAGLGNRVTVVPITSTNSTKPVPLHRGARAYLVQQGYIASNDMVYWILLSCAALIAAAVYAQARCSAYDRLGNVRAASGTWRYRFMLLLYRFNLLVVVVFGLIALVFVLVESIQYFETEYARQHNIRNQFADIGFWDAVLWMFIFMGSGHTDNVFPLSPQGRIMATALPFLGIGGLLGFLFIGFDRARERKAERKRGRLPVSAKNHVLVCGWNEKAKGIVYGLTSDDVPRRKPVVVVAEIDGDMPLEGHDFNPQYVSYLRGDSADHTVLAKANIEHADAAVVVAGVKKRAGRNVRSILSVMALTETYKRKRELKDGSDQQLFVAAELLYDENRPLFHACGAKAIVTAELVANRVAAQCCVNEHIVDFVLDALTYDDSAELYSTQVGKIGERTDLYGRLERISRRVIGRRTPDPPLIGKTLQQARTALARFGINVVGVARNRKYGNTFLGDIFDDDKYQFPQDPQSRDMILESEHVLLFFANDHDDVHIAAASAAQSENISADAGPVIQADVRIVPKSRTVLLVGDWLRCSAVRDILEAVPWCTVRILTEMTPDEVAIDASVVVGNFCDLSSWKRADLLHADQVMILVQSGEQTKLGQVTNDYGEVDARTIFAARFAQDFFDEIAKANDVGKPRPTIAAEMLSHKNRSLFDDANIDVMVPSGLLVERMLTKLVYSKGAVCRFLMALLAFNDDRHIMTITLEREAHASLLDKSFQDLMVALPREAQLLGIVPAPGERRERFKDSVGDLDYHVLTCPATDTALYYRSQPGDKIILILNRTLWTNETSATARAATR